MDSIIGRVKEKGIGQGLFKNEKPLDRALEYRHGSLASGRHAVEFDLSISVARETWPLASLKRRVFPLVCRSLGWRVFGWHEECGELALEKGGGSPQP